MINHTRYTMMRIFTLAGAILAFSSMALAQPANKADEKFWKDKAKAYVKDPMALKAEFENYQNQIKDLKQRNKDLTNQLNTMQSSGGPKVDSMKWEIIQLKGELQAMQTQYEKLQAAYQTLKTTEEMGIRSGLVYRVQIGAYVFNDMRNVPVNDDVIIERADGFNKWVIGSYRTYEEAAKLKEELVKAGLKDAFIVPYIDGIRASIQEADNYLKNQGRP